MPPRLLDPRLDAACCRNPIGTGDARWGNGPLGITVIQFTGQLAPFAMHLLAPTWHLFSVGDAGPPFSLTGLTLGGLVLASVCNSVVGRRQWPPFWFISLLRQTVIVRELLRLFMIFVCYEISVGGFADDLSVFGPLSSAAQCRSCISVPPLPVDGNISRYRKYWGLRGREPGRRPEQLEIKLPVGPCNCPP